VRTCSAISHSRVNSDTPDAYRQSSVHAPWRMIASTNDLKIIASHDAPAIALAATGLRPSIILFGDSIADGLGSRHAT
jgi:hypothetical protein